jgi:hypothetical protein
LISTKTKQLNFLKQEVKYKKIAEQLSDKLLHNFLLLITRLLTLFVLNFIMFFGIKRSILFFCLMSKIFLKKKITTKAKLIQMNTEILDFCQKEIVDLLTKGIIRKSKSPWSCAAFYVRKMLRLKEECLD